MYAHHGCSLCSPARHARLSAAQQVLQCAALHASMRPASEVAAAERAWVVVAITGGMRLSTLPWPQNRGTPRLAAGTCAGEATRELKLAN